MTLLLSSLCFIMCIIFSYTENKKTRNLFTPVFCFSILYSFIMVYVAFIDLFKGEGEYRMSYMVPVVSTIFFLIFFAIGYIFMFSFDRKLIIKRRIRGRFFINRYLVAILYILLLFLGALYFIKYQKIIIPIDDFKEFFSTGFQGHIVNVITVLFLFIFTSRRKFKFTKLLAVVWIGFLALASAKYMMIIYTFSLVMIYYNMKKHFSLLRTMLIIIFISSLFVLTYILRFVFSGEDVDFSFIIKHFNYYLTGSYYSFSLVLTENVAPTENVGIGIVLAPIINMFKFISGNNNYVSSISRFVFVDVNSYYNKTNVFTLFGAILFETDIFVTILVVISLAIISYLLLYLLKKRPNAYTVILYSFFMSFMFCSFFNCFFGTLNFIEILVVASVIELLNYCYRILYVPKRKIVSLQLRNGVNNNGK